MDRQQFYDNLTNLTRIVWEVHKLQLKRDEIDLLNGRFDFKALFKALNHKSPQEAQAVIQRNAAHQAYYQEVAYYEPVEDLQLCYARFGMPILLLYHRGLLERLSETWSAFYHDLTSHDTLFLPEFAHITQSDFVQRLAFETQELAREHSGIKNALGSSITDLRRIVNAGFVTASEVITSTVAWFYGSPDGSFFPYKTAMLFSKVDIENSEVVSPIIPWERNGQKFIYRIAEHPAIAIENSAQYRKGTMGCPARTQVGEATKQFLQFWGMKTDESMIQQLIGLVYSDFNNRIYLPFSKLDQVKKEAYINSFEIAMLDYASQESTQ